MTNQLPVTLDDWREFMNGYRDPLTRQAEREALTKEDEDFFKGGGGMNTGGAGERECGHRKEGGVYATVASSPYGKPVDYFLTCKPMPISKEEYNLSNVGVRLVDLEQTCDTCGGIQTKGLKTCKTCFGTGKEVVTHIFDIVGKDNYPNIADFMEEARRLGVSRRLELETSAEYARLSKRSRLFLLHHRAVINNASDLLINMGAIELARLNRAGCPKNQLGHYIQIAKGEPLAATYKPHNFEPCGCSALYWNILEEGAVTIPEFSNGQDNFEICPKCDKKDPDGCGLCKGDGVITRASQFVERKLKSGSYRGYSLPLEVTLEYSLGVFAVFPLGKIEVVDPDGSYQGKVSRARAARLDVDVTEC